MNKTDVTVVRFGARRLPRALASLPSWQVGATTGIDTAGTDTAGIDTAGIDTAGTDTAGIDTAVRDARRVVVVGTDADLAAVLTRLMRTDRLEVEVAHLPGRRGARRALAAAAHRVPLVRDETGTALVGAALWLPPAHSGSLGGEAVVDDTVLFDGDVAGVRIEPTSTMPGLRAVVLAGWPRRWVSGRAAQLGTTGVRVVRDGVVGPRELTRSTFYRHTTGWLRVG